MSEAAKGLAPTSGSEHTPGSASLLDRPRLVDLVDRGVEGPLTLISAPAGSGKTVLLRTWMAAAAHPETIAHAERAERNEPRLRTHDRYGNRIDEVDLDPSWHWLLRQAIEREIHSLPWR